MNLCFLQGKVIGNIEFKFILNSPNISVAIFDIELTNKSIVKIKAYDELADYCYSKLKENNQIVIYGYLKEETVILENITVLISPLYHG